MKNDRALVRNAADAKQVGIAAKREKDDRELELADLRTVLETPQGRRFLWRLMGKFKWGQVVFDPIATTMAFNAGMQNAGNFLVSEITEADDQQLLVMMQESQARERSRNSTVDALATPAAATGDDHDDAQRTN